jgi:hypothetical protein
MLSIFVLAFLCARLLHLFSRCILILYMHASLSTQAKKSKKSSSETASSSSSTTTTASHAVAFTTEASKATGGSVAFRRSYIKASALVRSGGDFIVVQALSGGGGDVAPIVIGEATVPLADVVAASGAEETFYATLHAPTLTARGNGNGNGGSVAPKARGGFGGYGRVAFRVVQHLDARDSDKAKAADMFQRHR